MGIFNAIAEMFQPLLDAIGLGRSHADEPAIGLMRARAKQARLMARWTLGKTMAGIQRNRIESRLRAQQAARRTAMVQRQKAKVPFNPRQRPQMKRRRI